MTAYYNENDKFAAAWLRELILDGLIAPGIVDDRSIEDVQPSDLRSFTQVHLFAGVGVWSLAARIEGIPDDQPLWTASCPCPPFSSAGPDFRCPVCDTRSPVPNAVRTGAFDCVRCSHEWQADKRHLWPEVFRLARVLRPRRIVGEQVASADGRTWIDVVSASLEMLGYAVGSPDTCSAGFGAPHIRQRLYWFADHLGDADDARLEDWWRGLDEQPRAQGWQAPQRYAGLPSGANRLADDDDGRCESVRIGGVQRQHLYDADGRREDYRLVDSDSQRLGKTGSTSARQWIAERSTSVGLADTDRSVSGQGRSVDAGGDHGSDALKGTGFSRSVSTDDYRRPGPVNGLWRDADWLFCRDEKWRAVESGTFPLVDAGAFRNRVGELRGAGNAVNVAQAAGFLRACMI